MLFKDFLGALALVPLLSSIIVGCSGGKDEEEEEAVECCMLRQLAENCDSYNSTESLRESVRDWETVGESGDNDACIRMVDDSTLGCSGTYRYDEDDALTDCAD